MFWAASLHKYDATCYHHIDPAFGPDREGDLAALAAAHETEDPATWIWTAADGIVAGPTTPFAPDAGRGWEALAELADAHPADALRLEPVFRALETGLGQDFAAFEERIAGLGSGGMEGADYFGRACIKEVCDTDFAGIWLDAARREVFAWWRDDSDGALRIFPADRALWPAAALAKLAEEEG